MNTKTQAKCAVCGCRLVGIPHNSKDTCDGICTRAQNSGRSRGKQMEAEVRAVAKARAEDEVRSAPIGATGLGYRTENDYNRPYQFAVA